MNRSSRFGKFSATMHRLRSPATPGPKTYFGESAGAKKERTRRKTTNPWSRFLRTTRRHTTRRRRHRRKRRHRYPRRRWRHQLPRAGGSSRCLPRSWRTPSTCRRPRATDRTPLCSLAATRRRTALASDCGRGGGGWRQRGVARNARRGNPGAARRARGRRGGASGGAGVLFACCFFWR